MNDQIGNDGLTDAERAESARHFRETIGAPLTPKEGRALRAWREGRRASAMTDAERAQVYRDATDVTPEHVQASRRRLLDQMTREATTNGPTGDGFEATR